MPTVKTVSITYERKQNLGDYSSATVGCTIWADVRDDEDLHKAMTAIGEMAKNNVKYHLMPLVSEKKAASMHIEEMFLGLAVEEQPEEEPEHDINMKDDEYEFEK